jgi:hypothetical protein
MNRIVVRRLLAVAFVALLAVALSATVASAAPAANAWETSVSFARPNPFAEGILLTLDLRIVDAADADPVAYVDYRAILPGGFEYSHLTGTETLEPGQFAVGLHGAQVTNLVVQVTGGGYFQQFTFNVTWTQSGHPEVAASNDGGEHTVVQHIPTTASGTAVDLTNIVPFRNEDITASALHRVIVGTG